MCKRKPMILDDRQRETVRKALHRKHRYELGVRAELERAFMEIDLLEAEGVPRLRAASVVGLPPGCWEMFCGATRGGVLMTVHWQRKGRDYRGDANRISSTHFTRDGMKSLCGQPVPDSENHDVTWDEPGRAPCNTCRQLYADQLSSRGVHR